MLETILKSKVKTNLLAFLLAGPQRSFYVGELKRRIGARNVQGHLNELAKENIVKSFSKKGKKYFQVNPKHPLYWQIRGTAQKAAKKYEDELFKYLKKLPGLKVAILTGIFTANPHMSCDVLLVGKLPEKKLLNFEKGIKKLMGQEINYALFSVGEYEARKSMFDRFMKDVLENDHLVVMNKIR